MLRETSAARITSRSTPALRDSPVREKQTRNTIATRARLIGLSPLRRFQDKTRPRSRERGSELCLGALDPTRFQPTQNWRRTASAAPQRGAGYVPNGLPAARPPIYQLSIYGHRRAKSAPRHPHIFKVILYRIVDAF